MIKKAAFLLAALILVLPAQAKDLIVEITPQYKITTAQGLPQIGDNATFVVTNDVYCNSKLFIKKGTKVEGMVSDRIENDWGYTPAELYFEKFTAKDIYNNDIKLKGVILKKGNEHPVASDFVVLGIVRGGEVQIKPQEDIFTLFVEVK